MRSGLLNERMTVVTVGYVPDDHGAMSPVFHDESSCWCRVLHANSDRSDSDADRVVYNPNIRFELRASVPIKENDIISYDGDLYVITMIEKNRNMDIQTLYVERYERSQFQY